MICLCSKTYICHDEETNTTRMSCKGVNKNVLANNDPVSLYQQALFDKTDQMSVNRGFKVKDHAIITYEIEKRGLNYFYPKRKVLSDGITTKPLDL